MALTYESARQLLKEHGQAHLLAFWGTLNESQRARLLAQIEGLDFDNIARMKGMLSAPPAAAAADFVPAPVIVLQGDERAAAVKSGEKALAAGEVGVLLVAGGQGSRLGYEGPKGCYAIGPISGASLFEIHARKILALEHKFKAHVPFYIMTSATNDEATRAFFDTHDYFGLSRDRVKFFTQDGTWPALTQDGKIVMDAPDHFFASPDGHGGILTALRKHGMLDDMTKHGTKTLFYFQVDNPLVEIADPAFIGVHRDRKADISIKVCTKRDPHEGVGVVVISNGRSMVKEYSELTSDQKHAKGPDGRLKYLYGSVAIHVFSLDFLKRESTALLPLHLAHKKVPYVGADGRLVKPTAPNAYKFEKFIFDVVPDATTTINVEFAREEEFSPVKNATGDDSPATAQRDMMLKFARWMKACGVDVPMLSARELAHKIEIDPCYALGPEDLKARLPAGFTITGDTLLK